MNIGLGPSWARRTQAGGWDGAVGSQGVASKSGTGEQGQDHRAVTARGPGPGQSHNLPARP